MSDVCAESALLSYVEANGVDFDDFKKALVIVGELLCAVLEVLPSNEIGFSIRVSEDCCLEFSVKKV